MRGTSPANDTYHRNRTDVAPPLPLFQLDCEALGIMWTDVPS